MINLADMDNIYWSIGGFLITVIVIIYSGSKLSVYGDRIAELTGMGKAWVGLILMASVTSLPELITGISSVAIVGVPDIAAGDIFGSCVFNLLILSVLDLRLKQPLFSSVKSSHVTAAMFGLILLSVAGLSIFLSHQMPMIFSVSLSSVLLIGVYLLSVWGIYQYDKMDKTTEEVTETKDDAANPKELRKVIGLYVLNALVVIGAAIFLPHFGEHIAKYTGMSESFFGTLFIAAATSLPELVVSLAALRLGAMDMVVGNLLGSNIFNMMILALDDVFYTRGSLYADISSSHLVSVFFTMAMTAVTGLGIMFRPKKKHFWLLSFDTLIIGLLYLVLISYLFINK